MSSLLLFSPLDFWVPAKGGKAPLIQAPWGETFQPPVFHESGFDISDPYAVGCGNSERFLDWQFNRATIAVFGRPIPRKKDECCYVANSCVVTSPRTQFVTVASMTGFAMLATIVTMLRRTGIACAALRVRCASPSHRWPLRQLLPLWCWTPGTNRFSRSGCHGLCPPACLARLRSQARAVNGIKEKARSPYGTIGAL